MSKPVVIDVDDRRRISLGKLGRHTQYLATEMPDGTIVLEPAVLLSEADYAFLRNTDLRAQIEDNRAHPERRRPRPTRVHRDDSGANPPQRTRRASRRADGKS